MELESDMMKKVGDLSMHKNFYCRVELIRVGGELHSLKKTMKGVSEGHKQIVAWKVAEIERLRKHVPEEFKYKD